MKIFHTKYLNEKTMKMLSADDAAHIYNGLDCCVTSEVYTELVEQLDLEPPNVRETYEFALNKQAPFMEMALRGTLIDEGRRQSVIRDLEEDLRRINRHFQMVMVGVFDTEVNWRSPTQLKTLFYGSLGLKEVKARNAHGKYVATTNRKALEKFRNYIHVAPIANMILKMRDIQKALGFLRTEIDSDGRMRTSYNLAGTNTGRLSSRMNDFGTGTNLQNVDRKLRNAFVADPGMYLFNIDLEQADARNVGARLWTLFLESHGPEFAGAYLDACESGDLHTTVCQMAWTGLDWNLDNPRETADRIAYRDFSYRDMAKKLGHGTNYYGTPRTMAGHTNVETALIEDFQRRYFGAFPAIPLWHEWVIDQVQTHGILTTLFGRRRMFFGRGKEATTHRKAIAYEPQSMTGEEIDRGIYQIWKTMPQVQLLNQVHDSVLLQVPFRQAALLLPQILDVMKVEIELIGGRKFSVPLDVAGGWNWGYYSETNPHGMKAWEGSETRNQPSPGNRLKDYL